MGDLSRAHRLCLRLPRSHSTSGLQELTLLAANSSGKDWAAPEDLPWKQDGHQPWIPTCSQQTGRVPTRDPGTLTDRAGLSFSEMGPQLPGRDSGHLKVAAQRTQAGPAPVTLRGADHTVPATVDSVFKPPPPQGPTVNSSTNCPTAVPRISSPPLQAAGCARKAMSPQLRGGRGRRQQRPRGSERPQTPPDCRLGLQFVLAHTRSTPVGAPTVPSRPGTRAAVIRASRALLCGPGPGPSVKSGFCVKRKSIELPLLTAVIYKHKGAFMVAHPTGHMAAFCSLTTGTAQ